MKRVRVYGLTFYHKDNKKMVKISLADVDKPYVRMDIGMDYKDAVSYEDIRKAVFKSVLKGKGQIEIAPHIKRQLPIKDALG